LSVGAMSSLTNVQVTVVATGTVTVVPESPVVQLSGLDELGAYPAEPASPTSVST
jgi:hypothetical protein